MIFNAPRLKRIILCIICSLGLSVGLSLALCQDYDYNRTYTAKQLRKDVIFMKKALEEAHPSLYWYTSKHKLQKVFAATIESIKGPMTERTFYDLLRPLTAAIHCGHTSLLMSEAFDESADKPSIPFLPLDIWVEESRVFVTGNNSTDSSIVAGDEVLSISGIPVQRIIQKALSIQPSDGYNSTFGYHFLNWYLFKEVSWAYFNIKPPYQLQTKHSNGEISLHSIVKKPKTGPPSQPKAETTDQEKEKQRLEQLKQARRLDLPDALSSTALLTINGFGYEDAYDFHREVFTTLRDKNIKNLIIDVRQNPGGNISYAVDLMSYLVDTSFYIQTISWAKLKNPNRPSFARYFDEETKNLLAGNTKYLYAKDRKYFFETAGLGVQHPQKQNRFEGRVYLLTGGFTFSAGAMFVSSLRAQRAVTIIGQETGGGEAGCTAGILQRLTLPNSRLRLRFPLFRILSGTKNKNQGRGVRPDYEVNYTWKEKVLAKDLEVEKAIELIKGN